MELLGATPDLNSTDLRKAGLAASIKPGDLSAAIAALDSRGEIQHKDGPHRAKPSSLRRRLEGFEPALPASQPAYAGSTEAIQLPASPSLE